MNVAMPDVIQEIRVYALQGPLSQPCCCSPQTAKGRPVRFHGPSRNWGTIGRTANGGDVMVYMGPLCLLFSHMNPVLVPVLKGPELDYHAVLKRCDRR